MARGLKKGRDNRALPFLKNLLYSFKGILVAVRTVYDGQITTIKTG